MRKLPAALACVVAVSLFGRDALAECTKDVECKIDRICVDGGCVDPPARAPVVASPPVKEAPAGTDAAPEPAVERRSPHLIVAGVAALALTPVAVAVSLVAASQQNACEDYNEASKGSTFAGSVTFPKDCSYDVVTYGGVIGAVAFLGGGLGMLLYGAQPVPAEAKRATMTFAPWLTASTGGIAWRAAF